MLSKCSPQENETLQQVMDLWGYLRTARAAYSKFIRSEMSKTKSQFVESNKGRVRYPVAVQGSHNSLLKREHIYSDINGNKN